MTAVVVSAAVWTVNGRTHDGPQRVEASSSKPLSLAAMVDAMTSRHEPDDPTSVTVSPYWHPVSCRSETVAAYMNDLYARLSVMAAEHGELQRLLLTDDVLTTARVRDDSEWRLAIALALAALDNGARELQRLPTPIEAGSLSRPTRQFADHTREGVRLLVAALDQLDQATFAEASTEVTLASAGFRDLVTAMGDVC